MNRVGTLQQCFGCGGATQMSATIDKVLLIEVIDWRIDGPTNLLSAKRARRVPSGSAT